MKKAGIIFLGVALAFIAIFVFKVHDFYKSINTGDVSGFHKPTVSPEKTSYNVLLLGYGGEGHEGAYLTDTMMVAHIDLKTNRAVLVSLPRDLWVKVPGKTADFHAKINSVYEMGLFPEDYPQIPSQYTGKQGAAELVKKTVGDLTGLPIDNYVGVDFGGFKQIIDMVGGVDINVETTFDDYEYPIEGKENELCGKDDQFKQVEPFLSDPNASDSAKTDFFKDKPDLETFYNNITDDPAQAFPCRYEHLHFDKGPQHMDGTTALKYARSRHSLQDGTDFGRARRQQKVIEAVKNKVFSITFLPKILPLMDDAKSFVRMDLDVNQIKKLLGEAGKDASKYRVTSIVPSLDDFLKNGVADNGQYILTPINGRDSWGDMRLWIHNAVEGITPTPTPAPTSATASATMKKPTSTP
jgi:LCP family protein required for cell wall assembly